MIPRLIGHVEGDGFAGERIAIPIRQLKIIVAADDAGAVEDTGPSGFANAVGGAPPPPIEIVDIVNLNFANGSELVVEQDGLVAGAIPAELQIPLLLPVCGVARAGIETAFGGQHGRGSFSGWSAGSDGANERRNILRDLVFGEAGN